MQSFKLTHAGVNSCVS